ncbi:MAG: hypothetical protein IJ533_09785 [Prevotella sp.]|nr:hypothetical protein [Prevotella sp.]
MIKKEYLKPAMRVVELQHRSMILAGSVTSVSTTGLDDDDLALPGEGLPTTGSVWDDAW